MGIKFMAMAIDAKIANSGQKFVLVMLANHCNDHTRQCNPSQKLLAEECSMGLSTLKRHLSSLEEAGYIETVNVFKDNIQRPNQYLLKLSSSPNRATPQPESGYPPSPNRATEPEVKTRIEPVDQKNNFFDEFWKAYPRKTNKGFAKKVFEKLKVDDPMLTKMVQAIHLQNKTVWKDKDQQYIPHPSTWLNGERWEDEVSAFVKPVSAAERATNFALGRPSDSRLLTPEEQAAREKARLLR
jgi:DNA-binding transcriptional ArsR family regulator